MTTSDAESRSEELPPTREFQPFDPRLAVPTPSGEALRYVESALDTRYLAPVPADWRHGVRPGMLPPQDLELRKEIDRWREACAEVATFNWWRRWLRRMDLRRAQARADLHERRVRALVRKSAEHRAAAQRIENAAGQDAQARALAALLHQARTGAERTR